MASPILRFRKKSNEPLASTFTNTWDHLLVGRYDIDPEVIEREAFYRDGKVYTYYGVFPAFVRGVIEFFFNVTTMTGPV